MANLPGSIKNLNTLLGEQLTEGGGGSSDFSTAQVTLISNMNAVQASMAIARDEALPFITYPRSDGSIGMESGDEFTLTAILYKGICQFYCEGASSLAGTGNVQVIANDTANITGDCTITINPAG